MKTFSLFLVFASALLAQSTGLDFPSNGGSPINAFIAFQFLDPQDHGLPFWGPGGGGTTFIWKYKPRPQAGYYVTFWWSNDGSFLWDGGSPNTYYGAHPYPRGGGGSTTSHDWEIATDRGGDYTNTRTGAKKPVVKDIWYTQALRVTRNSNGGKTLVFYTEIPSVADADVVEVTVQADYGEKNPPAPAITFGDSPWFADFYGNERLSGILRHIKIFNRALSQGDLLAEAASENLATSEGAANIWYMNINPTPDDIADHSGKGHHFAWANPNHKAGLWTGAGTEVNSKSPSVPSTMKLSSRRLESDGVTVLLSHGATIREFDLRGRPIIPGWRGP